MTEAVEQKLVTMLDALQQGVVQLGDTAVKYAPDVADAALWFVRIDGLQQIVAGIACILLSYVAYRGLKWAAKKSDEQIAVVCLFALLVLPIAASFNLLNVWNWVAVFEPKLALAKMIIEKAM